MNRYRITILNTISRKKRNIWLDAVSFEAAIEAVTWQVHYASEEIRKIEVM